MTFQDYLKSKNACIEALTWAGDRTLEEAWVDCERGDWLLWVAEKTLVAHKLVILATCDCAQTAWEHCDDETLMAVMFCDHVVREWYKGRADVADLQAGRSAAANAACASGVTAGATTAAVATAYAATYAIDAATYAAIYAADAASANPAGIASASNVAYTAVCAATYATRKAAQIECCRLIRKRIPVTLIATAISQERK